MREAKAPHAAHPPQLSTLVPRLTRSHPLGSPWLGLHSVVYPGCPQPRILDSPLQPSARVDFPAPESPVNQMIIGLDAVEDLVDHG